MASDKIEAPHDLYSYLGFVRRSPSTYLKDYSIKSLFTHIQGYRMALWIHGIKSDNKPDFKDFTQFVADYYKIAIGKKDWAEMILEKSEFVEEHALKTFFIILDAFTSTTVKE